MEKVLCVCYSLVKRKKLFAHPNISYTKYKEYLLIFFVRDIRMVIALGSKTI